MNKTSELPWTVETDPPRRRARQLITVVSPRGVVAHCGDTRMPGALEDAQLIVRAVNAQEATRLNAALLPFARYAALVLDQAAARGAPLRDADIVLRLDDTLITVGDLRRAVAEVQQ